MKKTAQKIILSLFVCALFPLSYFLLSDPIKAQNTLGTQTLTVIPPRLEIQVKPGEFVKKTIQFRNESETTAYLTAVPKDFIVTDNKGTPEFVTAQVSGRWSAASWLKVSPSNFSAAPKQTVNITLTANIPLDALPGGHYAGILYQSTPSNLRLNTGLGAGSGIQQTVGTLVYLTVAGPVKENAIVKSFTIPSFLEFGPVRIISEISNLSDLHIMPKGQITIRNMFGKTSKILSLEERNIFPGASLVFDNSWSSKYLLGRYRADLTASYGSQGKTLMATAYFIVFPVRIALAVILALIIIVLLIVYYRRRQKTKEEQAEIEEAEKPQAEKPKEKTA